MPGPKTTRQNHVPQRMCIVCRRKEDKQSLIRIARCPDGRVEPDPRGTCGGRGAYLCQNPACWQLLYKRRALERALHIETIHSDDKSRLVQWMENLKEATVD